MKTTTIIGLICVAGLTAGLPLSAKDKPGKGNRGWAGEKGNKYDEQRQRRGEGQRTFSEDERVTIYNYVERYGQQEGKHPRSLPPGLAKKIARGGKLPPGWEAKVVRGQIMPVEVYEVARPLPRELAVRLPVPPIGTVTVAVGGKVARVLEATREILDVFDVHVHF